MPIAFADGSGGWNVTNRSNGAFAAWAQTTGVEPLTGDFNGDGRTDVALIRRTAGWGSMPIAFADGTGGWNITNGGTGAFATWARVSGAKPLKGDFNNDGRMDVALIRRTAGWSSMPVAFANGSGGWTIKNGGVGIFATWARTSGVEPLTGDFNNDGRTDVALIRRTAGWGSMPVAFANGAGGWSISNGGVGDFAAWGSIPTVRPLTGDFNNDGRTDVALIRQASGWGSMPVALATNVPPPAVTHRLTISRYSSTTPTNVSAMLTDTRADEILDDAATVLQVNDGPGDVACSVAFARSGNVGVFTTGDGSLDTKAELNAVFKLAGNVKVVREVNYCGKVNTSFIGCGGTPGTSFVVERHTTNEEGILWAHEFGHNQGVKHRTDSDRQFDARHHRYEPEACQSNGVQCVQPLIPVLTLQLGGANAGEENHGRGTDTGFRTS